MLFAPCPTCPACPARSRGELVEGCPIPLKLSIRNFKLLNPSDRRHLKPYFHKPLNPPQMSIYGALSVQ